MYSQPYPRPLTSPPDLQPIAAAATAATAPMAFLYDFATPRTKPLQLEQIHHTSVAASLLNAATGFFSKQTNEAATSSAASASSSASSVAAAAPPDLQSQLIPASPPHNLALASRARAAVVTALRTSRSIDKEAESKRIEALRTYLPFIRTMVAQLGECDDSERRRVEQCCGGELEWSTVLQVGARPTAADVVPFFKYGRLDLGEELAHAYFNLALSHYQRAASLSFRAWQMANTIPTCSFLHLIPWYAAAEAAAAGETTAEPVRKFNPLSFVPSLSSSSSEPKLPPKSAEEIASIRTSILAERKLAVESLRTAAGVFDFLASTFLPTLPLPSGGRRMVDTLAGASAALRTLSLVHCQQHSLLSATLHAVSKAGSGSGGGSSGPSSSAGLLAKLCQGCVHRLGEAAESLRTGTGSYANALEPSLHVFLRVSTEYWRQCRALLLAVEAETSGEHGRAIALLSHASDALTRLCSNDRQAGIDVATIRDCNPVLSELKQSVARLQARTATVLARLRKDNDSVYFQRVPDAAAIAAELTAAEADKDSAVWVATPLAFTPPPTLPALFLQGVRDARKWTSGEMAVPSSATTSGAH